MTGLLHKPWYHRLPALVAGLSLPVMAFSPIIGASAEEGYLRRPGKPAVEMIKVPGGVFLMGSPNTEAGRSNREGPQLQITFARPFALGKTEVTVAQFRQFVVATGYVTDAEKSGESNTFSIENAQMVPRPGVSWRQDFLGNTAQDSHPVIHVSWNDAQAFVGWLSANTGERFRLPTESEFEYALRAGSVTRFWWGDGSPQERVENLSGGRERYKKLRWPVAFRGYTDRHWGPSPVASFKPNPFGLFDMGGNAAEWVEDCFEDSLGQVPADGRPAESGGCDMRVFRGGAWAYPPALSRSAYRNAALANTASALVGFRVARDL